MTRVPKSHPFLAAGGEAAEIIAGFDWASTSLGPVEAWPAGLKNTIGLILDSPVPIVTLWGEDGVMIYNDAYSAFAGGRHPVLFGSKVREGWPEVADFNDNVMKVGLSGKTLAYREFPLTLYRHDGKPEQVWLNLDYSPVRDEHGKPIGVIAIVVEITEKVRVERALEAERASLRRMFEQAPGFIAIVSGPDHRFEMVNESYRRLVARREVLQRPVAEALPEVVEQGFVKLLDQVYATGEPFVARRARINLRHEADGALEERYLDFVYQPITLETGITSGIFIQGHDVTEQHQVEEAIRAESRKLSVLNHTGAAVAAELDIERIVQIVTEASTELVGAQFGAFFYNVVDPNGESYMLYTLAGASRADFEGFPMPRNTAVFEPTFQGAGVIRSGDILKDARYGLSAPHFGMPKGHLSVRSYLAVPVTSRTGAVIGGFFFGHGDPDRFAEEHEELLIGIAGQAATAMDNARLFQAAEREIAERRRAEEALQRLNNTLEQRVLDEVYARSKVEEQLRQVQKMEAIGQLTGGIAHDFNNMLAVIMGGLNLLQRKLAQGEVSVDRYVNAALEGAERAATLTQRLLAFSRQQPLAPEPVVVGDLITGMTELLSRTLGEQVLVETHVEAGVWQVTADPTQLENAILNLAVNARDAMSDGGRLDIAASNAQISAGDATEYAVEPGDYVLIAVTDTGSGMAPEVIAKAFDPFYTTKSVGKGTGLGLSQVYGFVRQSGGHVKITSTPGAGASVRIYLPRHFGEAAIAEGVKRLAGSQRGRGEMIMVVEDDDRVRAVSVEALKELGYRVVEAAGPLQALRLFEQGAEVSLLFTDVVMPDMSGNQLASRVRETRPNLKVLYATGYTRNAFDQEGKLGPGTSLLTKPFRIDELAAKVRNILDEVI